MRQLKKRTLAVGASAAMVLAIVAVGLLANNHHVVPVTYSADQAPPVSPAEAQRAVDSAKSLSTAFRVASSKVLPAVVSIKNVSRPMPLAQGERQPPVMPFGNGSPFEGSPLEDLFKDRGLKMMPPARPQPRSGMGSGFIIDPSGVILTNNHVVAGNGEVTVRMHDGREFQATNVWTDPKTDVAVVKIDAQDLPAVKLGNSDVVAVGDWVLALGQPFGLKDTVTAGIISAKHRGIGITDRENFLQTDAAINPGNSGGPLVNLDGEVVGINTAISSRTGGNDGIGFAVPINLAKWVGDQLAKDGVVRRAYLGVHIQPVTAPLAEQFQVKPYEGVAVTDVVSNTPADAAGLKSGDVIVNYAGLPVSSPHELQILVERSQLDKPHELTVVREGKRITLQFVPREQPTAFGVAAEAERADSPRRERLDKLGLQVGKIDEAVAEQLGMKGVSGVVITGVRSGSTADKAGLRTGMAIVEVNRQAVASLDGFTAAIEKLEADDRLLLLIRSGEGSRFVVLK